MLASHPMLVGVLTLWAQFHASLEKEILGQRLGGGRREGMGKGGGGNKKLIWQHPWEEEG